MLSTTLVAITLLGLDCVACAYIGLQCRQFLRHTPVLRSQDDFDRYRRVVIRCMWSTFWFVTLFITASMFSFGAVLLGFMRRSELEPIAQMAILRLVCAVFVTVWYEAEMKEIPADGPELTRLRNDILMDWNQLPWPRRKKKLCR